MTGAALLPGELSAQPASGGRGDDPAPFRLARLALADLPDPHPTALRRLALALDKRTSLIPHGEPAEVRPTDADLFRYPMLWLTGDRAFAPLPEPAILRLRRYLTFGGFLFIDSAEGRAGGAFDASARRLMARLLPGDLPRRVGDDHVLWRAFYLLKGPAGRVEAITHAEAVERDRRLTVLYSQNDTCGAMARDGFGRWEHDVVPGGEGQREMAFRYAVNTVMYALCLDYKEEQAHIDFILRTRRQRP